MLGSNFSRYSVGYLLIAQAQAVTSFFFSKKGSFVLGTLTMRDVLILNYLKDNKFRKLNVTHSSSTIMKKTPIPLTYSLSKPFPVAIGLTMEQCSIRVGKLLQPAVDLISTLSS